MLLGCDDMEGDIDGVDVGRTIGALVGEIVGSRSNNASIHPFAIASSSLSVT